MNEDKVLDILQFWRAIEYTTIQEFPEKVKHGTEMAVYTNIKRDQKLPWENQNFVSTDEYTWRHEIYLGIFKVKEVYQLLLDYFGSTEDDREKLRRSPPKKSAYCTFTVDCDGKNINSFVPTSLPWSVGKLIEGKKLNTFSAYEMFCEEYITEPWVKGEKAQEPLTHDDLEFILQQVKNFTRSTVQTDELGICISRKITWTTADSENTRGRNASFLNSLIARDLTYIENQLPVGTGKAFQQYLKIASSEPKIDVSSNTDIYKRFLEPKLFPRGHWPTKGHHPLVMTQQFAVNVIFERLGDSGLYSVNGPPGTGKTTLLRDIISEILVRRAIEMTQFAHPADAFSLREKGNSKLSNLYDLNPALLGHEVVVASANNGAVENVTNEIPGIESIDPSWFSKTNYFKEISDTIHQKPTWAMMAASLGNSAKRSKFVTDFWFGKKNMSEQSGITMKDILYADDIDIDEWNLALNRFKDSLASEEKIRRQRQCYNDALNRETELSLREQTLKLQIHEVESEKQIFVKQVESTKKELGELNTKIDEMTLRLNLTLTTKPGWLTRLFVRSKYSNWVNKLQEERSHYDYLRSHRDHGKNLLEVVESNLNAANLQCAKLHNDYQTTYTDLISSRSCVQRAKEELKDNFPDGEYWSGDEEQKHVRAPWIDDSWNRSRTEVFLSALELHRVFILGANKCIRSNLNRLINILSGNVSGSDCGNSIKSLWGTLFLIVPVISTTFASFAQLFEGMGQESLGWLLVDEAGQAAPQLPLGAIWRSKRVVMVGDPLQLEPVVVTPSSVVTELSSQFDVDITWNPHMVSAQLLSDACNPMGTFINDIWVGAPLRVHRRCRNPMFGISNKIAYGDLMVHRGPSSRFNSPLGESAWFDVDGETSGRHWVPQEGVILKELIALVEGQIDSWCVITPFSNVSTNLRHLFSRDHHHKIGTVHTFQGKEASVVFLVLGTGRDEDGARSWAASKPNLLNVAVTRSIDRLYVIGNHKLWLDHKFFNSMGYNLPVIDANTYLLNRENLDVTNDMQ